MVSARMHVHRVNKHESKQSWIQAAVGGAFKEQNSRGLAHADCICVMVMPDELEMLCRRRCI